MYRKLWSAALGVGLLLAAASARAEIRSGVMAIRGAEMT